MKFMKMTLAIMFAFMVMAANVACEAAAETIDNGAELARVKRLAIGYPDYYKTLEKEPTTEEFIKAIFDASKVARTYIISYDEMATHIKQDTGIDIKVIPKMDARRIFKEQVYKYADGYLIVTLANNSRVTMFCDVYAVNTNERVYSLQIPGNKSDDSKNFKSYKTLAEEFFRTFDRAAQAEAKKEAKNNKD